MLAYTPPPTTPIIFYDLRKHFWNRTMPSLKHKAQTEHSSVHRSHHGGQSHNPPRMHLGPGTGASKHIGKGQPLRGPTPTPCPPPKPAQHPRFSSERTKFSSPATSRSILSIDHRRHLWHSTTAYNMCELIHTRKQCAGVAQCDAVQCTNLHRPMRSLK